jgi:transposase
MVSLADESTFVGLDVGRDRIAVGVLRPGEESPTVEMATHDVESVRRLVGRFPDRRRLRVCYEAGPTGFELHRLLTGMGVVCVVVAPALIPTRPGDRVKTDRRDAHRLVRLFRAGELTPIRIPTPGEEAVRDLCRTRADLVDDRRRTRQRVSSLLLRHGEVYRASTWTMRHVEWLRGRRFDQPVLTATFNHYLAALEFEDRLLAAIEADLLPCAHKEPFADAAHRLAAYRGLSWLGALTIASEVGDWRRFPSAASFTSFVGLVPGERSSGGTTHRGGITRTGNVQVRTQLIESAWAYQHRPRVGVGLAQRHQGLHPDTVARSWDAQQRLHHRFRTLAARKHHKGTVAVAVARELGGFLWAELTADPPPPPWTSHN